METKCNCAIRASKELVTNLHRDGLDRGCIATFSDFLTIRQSFTSDENLLHQSLNSLRNVVSGDTCLYDSISGVIDRTFRRNAYPSRPWVLIVVTDGDDNLSSMSSRQCSREIYDKFTKEDNNFMFVVGVGDRVNASKMQEMARVGYFDYIPVDDFLLLELAFLNIAYKVTKSLSLSLNNLAIGDISATWAEVQQHRQLSNVAIDYALLVDVSSSMNDMLRPQCFAGHDLRMVNGEYRENLWFCDVCGKDGPSSKTSEFHCSSCNFDACPSHCEPGRQCKPISRCLEDHPMRYVNTPGTWICDEDKKPYIGRHLRCEQCDYDMCPTCLTLITLMENLALVGR
ncbi:11349_t:CDS:2 [Funneliformis caledonium]|uniref:11349_t:CDS:1 n=1 Tax=Funneliformis caledonium TaxID=1117310 RepID=A0A9N9DW01_9GLOM|nr:11349_t:CDS:2 [Funneliformis caledonium]